MYRTGVTAGSLARIGARSRIEVGSDELTEVRMMAEHD